MANYNGQHGCLKCTTIGEYSYVSHTNIFPRTECESRTDEDFRMKLYEFHHKEDSPLLKLKIDMIKQFPVSDPLHLLHLGVVKRLLYGWREGTFRNSNTKWPAATAEKVSEYLVQCRMPAEFHRVVRGLDCLKHWKGTEYRTFLHYVGIVVLRDHLTQDLYEHFLLLFCAVTICGSKRYFEKLPVARAMLHQYIEIFAENYGEHHMTSNVHNLSHIVEEVERFGELDTISAYPFENILGKIKRMMRNGNRPLAQIAKRMTEENNCAVANIGDVNKDDDDDTKVHSTATLSKRNNGENVPDSLKSSIERLSDVVSFYSKIQLKNFQLRTTDSVNCWVLTKQKGIACVTNIIQDRNHIQLCCIESQEKMNFFKIPIESRHFDIYCTRDDAHSNLNEAKLIDLGYVECKLVRLAYHDMFVFIPLLQSSYSVDDEIEQQL